MRHATATFVHTIVKKPVVFSLCASLVFSSFTTINFAVIHSPGDLQFDSQLYANLSYNFALGRGFSLTNTGNCYYDLVTERELRDAIVNDPGPYVPNHERSPGGTVILGIFLKIAGLDLYKAELLLNFFGHWTIGFFIALLLYRMTGRRWVSALGLLMHYTVLTGGWVTTYPVIPVNLFLLMTVYFAQRWIDTKKKIHLIVCGTVAGILVVTRAQWLLFVPCLAFMLWLFAGRPQILRFVMRSILPFAVPLITLYAAWTVRNGLVLHDWAFEPRGTYHLFLRAYPEGWGSCFHPDSSTFTAIVESVCGPLPEKTKEHLTYQHVCLPDGKKEVYDIPAELRGPVFRAAITLIAKHPGNYLLSSYVRMKKMMLENLNPMYTPRKTLFLWEPMRDFFHATRISTLLLIVMYPMKWYLWIFWAVAMVVAGRILLKKSVPPILSLTVFAIVYNIFTLIFLSDNAGEYTCFTWSATAMVTAAAYWYVLRWVSSFIKKRFFQG
jgi:hypothetical protein